MDPIAFFSDGIRIIFGFLMVLLIPGFLVSLIFYPGRSDISIVERLVYSAILSIGSVITGILFMDVVLGIDSTARNIVIGISVFCVFLIVIWIIRHFVFTDSIVEKISWPVKKITESSITIIQGFLNNIVKKIKKPFKKF